MKFLERARQLSRASRAVRLTWRHQRKALYGYLKVGKAIIEFGHSLINELFSGFPITCFKHFLTTKFIFLGLPPSEGTSGTSRTQPPNRLTVILGCILSRFPVVLQLRAWDHDLRGVIMMTLRSAAELKSLWGLSVAQHLIRNSNQKHPTNKLVSIKGRECCQMTTSRQSLQKRLETIIKQVVAKKSAT